MAMVQPRHGAVGYSESGYRTLMDGLEDGLWAALRTDIGSPPVAQFAACSRRKYLGKAAGAGAPTSECAVIQEQTGNNLKNRW